MQDLIRDNIGKVIEFIQNEYGPLTEKEIDDAKAEPNRIYAIVQDKFGIDPTQFDDVVKRRVGAGFIGEATEGLTDKLGGFFNQ